MATESNTNFMKAGLVGITCSLLLFLSGCEKPRQNTPTPPPSVVVSAVTQETVPVVMQLAGTVQPVKNVKIVPRVSGYIFERTFTEGSSVTQGDPLYLIDPRPYKAKLDSLQAQLKQDQASYKFWISEAERYTRLAKKGAGSVEDKEKALAKKAEALAAVNADKADIVSAALQLEFTKITAPFSGHIQNTLAYVGDLVHQQETELTTVVQLDPVYVVSSISREQVYRIQSLQEQGLAPEAQNEFRAELVMPDGSFSPDRGTLNYFSSLIDPATDTLQVRFEFPNPMRGSQRSLIPGQYIPLRMIVGHKPDTLLIPEKALLQTQEGQHVFVVGQDNKVTKRMVTTGASYNKQWIVKSGLKKGEHVIVEGLQKIRPGIEVKITAATAH